MSIYFAKKMSTRHTLNYQQLFLGLGGLGNFEFYIPILFQCFMTSRYYFYNNIFEKVNCKMYVQYYICYNNNEYKY